MQKFSFLLFVLLLTGCEQTTGKSGTSKPNLLQHISYKKIDEIPLPDGYTRMSVDKTSFGEWLRNVSLKKDDHVYLYNGHLKRNQGAQFAVLDISVGDKDLQQCADAVMRLRAEYLFSEGKYNDIEFRDNENRSYRWTKGNDHAAFAQYLENVFNWCGTASLAKQLKSVSKLHDIKPGDVFIRGGFPGHAMIVTDVAINKEGKKMFMLAQSYMPAQDIHIVKNFFTDDMNPWYPVVEGAEINTPEWVFESDELKEW